MADHPGPRFYPRTAFVDDADLSGNFCAADGSVATPARGDLAQEDANFSVSFLLGSREWETTKTKEAAQHIVLGNSALRQKKLLTGARLLLTGARKLEPNTRVKITMDNSAGDVDNFLGPRLFVTRAELLRRSKTVAFAGAVAEFVTAEALIDWLHEFAPGDVADHGKCKKELFENPEAKTKLLAALVIALAWPDRRSELEDPLLKEWIREDTSNFTDAYFYAALFFVKDRRGNPVFRKNLAASLVSICELLLKEHAATWPQAATPSTSATFAQQQQPTSPAAKPFAHAGERDTNPQRDLSDEHHALAYLATNGRCPTDDIIGRAADYFHHLVAAAYMAKGGAAALRSDEAIAAFRASYGHYKQAAPRDDENDNNHGRARQLAGRALHNLAVALPDARAGERIDLFIAALEDPDLQDQVTPWANLVTALVAAGRDKEPIKIRCIGEVVGGVGVLVNVLLYEGHGARPLLSLCDEKQELARTLEKARERKARNEMPVLQRITSTLRQWGR